MKTYLKITLLLVVTSFFTVRAFAQQKTGYIFFQDRGYVYYFPISNAPKIDNTKDTACYTFNGFVVKEIKGSVLKDQSLQFTAMPGDTIQIKADGILHHLARRKD